MGSQVGDAMAEPQFLVLRQAGPRQHPVHAGLVVFDLAFPVGDGGEAGVQAGAFAFGVRQLDSQARDNFNVSVDAVKELLEACKQIDASLASEEPVA